eukprot:7644532-Lingulodinium_polyedra.AAC.1
MKCAAGSSEFSNSEQRASMAGGCRAQYSIPEGGRNVSVLRALDLRVEMREDSADVCPAVAALLG